MQKIDVSSTALEKGIDTAKGFIEKLIYPSAEELGLLFKDGIARWRFKNQIKTLLKTKEICEKHNINPKVVSPKLLYPLLEYASLEENDKLQDKWATLLSNMVDSDQNIENHVFPYLLSQLSIQEFEVLEDTFEIKKARVKSLTRELEEHLNSKEEVTEKIESEIVSLKLEIEDRRKKNLSNPMKYQDVWNLQNQLREYINKKKSHEQKHSRLEKAIRETELISSTELKDFEISNLIRLGVVKEIIRSYGYVDSKRVVVNKVSAPYESEEDYISLDDLSVTIETDVIENELTELGELFVKACQEKNTQN